MAVKAVLPDGTAVTAFNDIALVRIPGDGLSAVAVSVEGHPFVRYAADAVIVATSTGSTAYSFSAGGPIVSPRVEGFLVVPAAAHSAFNRALVLSADERVTLELLRRAAVWPWRSTARWAPISAPETSSPSPRCAPPRGSSGSATRPSTSAPAASSASTAAPRSTSGFSRAAVTL